MRQFIRAVTLSIILLCAGLVTGFFVPEVQAQEGINPRLKAAIVPDIYVGNVAWHEEYYEEGLYQEMNIAGVNDLIFPVVRYTPNSDIQEIVRRDVAPQLNLYLSSLESDEFLILQGYGVGGILMREYLEIMPESLKHKVFALSFVNTPHKGTFSYVPFNTPEPSYHPSMVPDEFMYWRDNRPEILKQLAPTNYQESYIDDLEQKEQDPGSLIRTLPVINIQGQGNSYTPIGRQGEISPEYQPILDQSTSRVDYQGIIYLKNVGDGYNVAHPNPLPFENVITNDIFQGDHGNAILQTNAFVFNLLGIPLTEKLEKYAWSDKSEQYVFLSLLVGLRIRGIDNVTIIPRQGSQIRSVNGFEDVLFVFDRVSVEEYEQAINPENVFEKTIKMLEVRIQDDSVDRENEVSIFIQDLSGYSYVDFSNSYPYKAEIEGTFNWFIGNCREYQGEINVCQNNVGLQTDETIIALRTYPLILIHGFMGGWNPELFGVAGETAVFRGLGPTFPNDSNWWVLPEKYDGTWDHVARSLDDIGLAHEEEYFMFFYDWRKTVQENSAELEKYIDYVQSVTNSSKVDILAHSMGGLVSRGYINGFGLDCENSECRSVRYEDDINKLIMAGTPNLGATSAVGRWYGGSMGINKVDLFMRWYLQVLAETSDSLSNQDRAEVIQRDIPSARDLLPVNQSIYIDDGYGLYPWDTIDNQFLVTMNDYEILNPLRNKVSAIAIAGNSLKTLDELTLTTNPFIASNRGGSWSFKYNDGLEYIRIDDTFTWLGDGTVTGNSVSNSNKYLTRTLPDQTEHKEVVRKDINAILDFLNIDRKDKDYNSLVGNTEFSDKTISFEVRSPLDLEVILPDGTILNEDTPEEVYQEYGVFYISLGDDDKKAMFISSEEEGEYKVNVTPNGDGDYTIVSNIISEDTEQFIESSVSGSVTQSDPVIEYEVTVDIDDQGMISDEVFEVVLQNTPPNPVLDQNIYTGIEEELVIFDASGSTDEQEDPLQYKWRIEGEYESEFLENPVLEYTFDDPYTGIITLTVTDGEFEESLTADVEVRAKTFEERILEIRELISSLEEDTNYISSKKRLWLRLLDMVELPVVQENRRLQQLILDILYRDIVRTIELDQRMDEIRSRFAFRWWTKPQDLVSDQNREILDRVVHHFQEIEKL